MRLRRLENALEDRMWDRMPPVGREFGSPDFEPLMEEDYRLGRGGFDPAVRQAFALVGAALTRTNTTAGRFRRPRNA